MNATAQYRADTAPPMDPGLYARQQAPEPDDRYLRSPVHLHRLASGELQASVDELPSPLALLGSRGRMEFANAAARELFASMPADAVPRQPAIAALAGEAFGDMLERATEGEQAVAFWTLRGELGPRCGNLRVTRLGDQSIYQRAWPQAAFMAVIHEFPVGDDGDRRLAAMARRCGLTPAEQRVLRCLQCGRTRRQAARELGIAENTVASHVKSIYFKAGVHRFVELMRAL